MPQPRASEEIARPAKQATPAEDAESQPVNRPATRAEKRPGGDGFSLGRASPAADPGFRLDTAPADVDPSFPVQAAASVAGADVSAATQDEAKEDAGSAVKSNVRFMTQEAFEFFWNRGRHHFVRLGNQTVALKRAAAELKNRVVDEGGVIGLRPASGIERYIEGRRAGKHLVRDASLETIEIAKLRREWEEAAASGEPDRMTRTANALIRAVEAERARTGAHESTHARGDSGRHPTSEILNPSRGSNADKLANKAIGDPNVRRTSGEGGQLAREGYAVYYPEAAHQSAMTPEPHVDSGVAPRDVARGRAQPSAERITLTGEQAVIAARLILAETPERRVSMLRRILGPIDDEVAEQLLRKSPTEIAAALNGRDEMQALSYRRGGDPERSDPLYRTQDRPGSKQKPYRPRDQTWEEWFWDWTPEGWGGPKDEFTSPPEDDRPPFDPRVGYYGRLQRRFSQTAQRLSFTEGVDIDGDRYRSLLMVGSNLNGKTTQGLSPQGVALLVGILCDRSERFRTAEDAVEFLAKVELAAGKTMNREQREGLRRSLESSRGAAVRLLDNDLRDGDGFQTIILIDSAFEGLVPEGRDYAEASVMAHELGHVVSRVLKVGESFEQLPAYERGQVANELEKAFRSSRTSQGAAGGRGDWERSPEEWFAEVFMVYLTEPEFAKSQAPLTCAILRRLWNRHPILSQILRLS
jgi:hypothetical protein